MQISRFPRAFGLYEMLILVFWVALWGVWPRLDRPARAAAGPIMPRVRLVQISAEDNSLHRRPDLIAHAPLEKDAWMAVADDVLPNVLPRRSGERSHPLPMGEPPGLLASTGGAIEPKAVSHTYRPLPLPVAGPVPSGPRVAPAVRADVSHELQDAGIVVPDEALAGLATVREMPWQVTVTVAFNDADRPAEIFVESPCEDAKVNAAVLAALRTMRATDGPMPCRGRVTVNYGSP